MRILKIFILLFIAINFQLSAQNTTDFHSWAKTPPMGWNSYNCYGANVRESEVLANTDFMAQNLKQFGWNYIVVDFCWFYPQHIKSTTNCPPQFRLADGAYVPWLAMDKFGRLLPDQNKFPTAKDGNGFKNLADYVHSKGLKFGIHIMRGIPRQAVWDKSPVKGAPGIDASMIADTTSICEWLNSMYGVDMSKKGAQEYYNSLMEMYAQWGVDFIKMDDISGEGKTSYYRKEVEATRKAIDLCGRPIVLSLSLNMKYTDRDHLLANANMWRVSPDFWDEWSKLEKQFGLANQWENAKSVGSWPDLDMLQLGTIARRGPVGLERETKFTPDEQKTHFTMWCISKSPLMMGGDLTVSNKNAIDILSNKEIIAMNQMGINAKQAMRTEKVLVWTSENELTKEKYVAIFNLLDTNQLINLSLKEIGIKNGTSYRDLWLHKNLGKSSTKPSIQIPAHGCVVYSFK